MALSAGARLGPYEILEPLGAGGMGEVYRAKDSRLDRIVAIKLLASDLSDSPALRQRLEREARAVSQLNHPHICALHDIGREGESAFLVMEHLEGATLAEHWAGAPSLSTRPSDTPARSPTRSTTPIATASFTAI